MYVKKCRNKPYTLLSLFYLVSGLPLYGTHAPEDDDVSRTPLSNNVIGQLSDEVLLRIFTYLDMQDKFRLAGVCRHFNNLVKDKYLWQQVNLSDCRFAMDGRILHRLLNRYILSEQVRNIILPRRFATNAVLRKIGKQCPNLEDLTLTNVSLTPKLNVNELPNSLRQISFIKCKVGKRSLYRSDLGVSLNFRTVRFLEYTCSHELGSCLRLLKNVQGLVISNCDCVHNTSMDC
ncbi:putative F-box/LRR-repeat protein 12 isoform X1 [Apostichopus japonicus]|uniref:Putative F-box/LRR-repeat protein 12 isoform X1 n=1 Tax=Stichopus japonicus TaxID=307972 RepID=A0A2G8JUA1_STIJA|nr:putative F-box/LRR-repeat protein 12 isoform X1 [Apostichopus japonicus]